MTRTFLLPRHDWPLKSVVTTPNAVPTQNDWAASYAEIGRLYVRERRKLRYIMQYMEREHGFKATEQMYKKRFAKWGFQKNSRRPTTAVPTFATKEKDECRRLDRTLIPCEELGSMPAAPGLSHHDGLMLMFLASVRTCSVAFFESPQGRGRFLTSLRQPPPTDQPWPEETKEVSFTFKLVVDLLDRGHGDLAGRMARKAFLLVEDMLMLEGPALVWNLLEIMHHMVKMHHAQLFQMLLAHLIALVAGRVPKTHPLQAMLCGLRGLVPSLKSRAWNLNAEILFDNFDPRLFQLYCCIHWDACSISPPAAIFGAADQWFSHNETKEASRTDWRAHHEERMLQRLLAPRMDASPPQDFKMLRANSIAALREHGCSILHKGIGFAGDTTTSLRTLAGLVTAKVLDESPALVGRPGPASSATMRVLHVQAESLACAIRTLLDLSIEHGGEGVGATLDAVERIRSIVALREYARGEIDPQVVWEMWLLKDALVAAGRYPEAQDVGLIAFQRLEKYIQDVPINSA
ncbi:hypothetical protein BU16DRAFT_465981 [Lophium mytilinum]|uniref:Clr5 domain-containing protein n=1 Tax=Lophium mytilinum TaxID=390894 RepID=A0A6A6QLN7_9PEZI|nr:hypothetical protein BU16DRAFT_465981 [Lophium mytilinum]